MLAFKHWISPPSNGSAHDKSAWYSSEKQRLRSTGLCELDKLNFTPASRRQTSRELLTIIDPGPNILIGIGTTLGDPSSLAEGTNRTKSAES